MRYTLWRTHAHTYSLMRAQIQTGHKMMWEYFKQGMSHQIWQLKRNLCFGCWVLSNARIYEKLYKWLQIQMTDRLSNWQLAWVGFSLARIVWLVSSEMNVPSWLWHLITYFYCLCPFLPLCLFPSSPSFSLSPPPRSSVRGTWEIHKIQFKSQLSNLKPGFMSQVWVIFHNATNSIFC